MSNNRLKIYIEGGNRDYARLMEFIGEEVADPSQANVIVFTGGSDVSPSLYGEKPIPQTQTNPARDADEVRLWIDIADNKKVAKLGICRGGQFLNVMNGGTLWQHVNGHTSDHPVKDIETGKLYKCSSTHHQMMRFPTDRKITAKMLAVGLSKTGGPRNTMKQTEKATTITDSPDIEAVYYPDTNSLCFQPHPEFEGYPECRDLFLGYVDKYVIPKLKENGAFN